MARTGQPAEGARASVVLAMLLVVYIFNYLDRMILSILAVPVQADLHLSDGQMGLLGGIAFAVLYSVLAVPLAARADRSGRSWMIAVSLVVWSGFTAACGLAHSFWHIFLARLGVGVGEAGGVAPSYALIADYFPPHRRAVALAVYSLGIPLGSAIGLLTGGYIAQQINWRVAFLVIGLAGLCVAPVFKATVRDLPARAVPDGGHGANVPAMASVARKLARKPSFWLLSLGAASGSAIGYGIGFWMPSFVHRSLGLDLFDTALFLAGVMMLGGVTGMLAGGWLGDRMGARKRAWYAWVPGIAYVAGVPFLAAGVATDTLWLAFVLFVIPQGLGFFWLGPVQTAIQHLVRPEERATASSLFLLVNNLIGLGGGIYGLGALSDALAPAYGSESLRMAIIGALGLYVLAGVLMALAGRSLGRDWVAE